MFGYIYMTTNLVNGRKYIGQHRYKGPGIDPYYFGSGKILEQALLKEGKENFKVEILHKCESQQELDTWECYYIDKYDALNSDEFYNIIPGGTGMRPGFKMPKEALKKMSESHKNRTRIFKDNVGKVVKNEELQSYLADGWQLGYSPEAKKRLGHGVSPGELNPMYGKKHSEETRRKMSEKAKGRTAWNKGKPNISATGTRWITNVVTLQRCMVPADEADLRVASREWRFGRN